MKKGIRLLLAASVIGTLATVLFADPPGTPDWEDSFNASNNWVTQHGTLTTSVADGKFRVENTGANIAVLKSDQTFTNFTYKVKLENLSSTYNYTGILFCWSDNFDGYVFTIADNQQWALQKMIRAGNQTSTKTIKTGISSFVNDTQNELKVSKNGKIITLFCNGYFLAQVDEGTATDTTFEKGIIGLVLNAGEKVAYDYAAVWKVAETGAPIAYFKDDFDDGNLNSWYIKQAAGDVSVQNGAIQLTAGTSKRQTIVLVNGNYNKGPVKAIATYKSGADSALYGLVRMALAPDGNFDALTYTINNARQRAVYLLSTRQGASITPNAASAINDVASDTLEITGPPDYQFFVNGKQIPGIDWGTKTNGLDFNLVGFIADSSVTVQFDEFFAGDSTQTAVRNPRRYTELRPAPTYMLGGAGIIIDPLGRTVRRLHGAEQSSLRNLGHGQYFVIPEHGKNAKQGIRRAIIVK